MTGIKLTRETFAEIVAVLLNLGYTGFYILGYRWCFILAFIGSILFIGLTFKRKIVAESLLHAFYVYIAVHGWLRWNDSVVSNGLSGRDHLMLLATGVVVWLTSALWLRGFSISKMSFIDTFTTIFSVLATWIMVNFDPINWWYWLVIDTVSIYLYWKRKLYFGAIMFVIYLILAIIGLIDAYG